MARTRGWVEAATSSFEITREIIPSNVMCVKPGAAVVKGYVNSPHAKDSISRRPATFLTRTEGGNRLLTPGLCGLEAVQGFSQFAPMLKAHCRSRNRWLGP